MAALCLQVALCGPAYAFIPTLDAAQVGEAIRSGEAMSTTEGGYVLGNYLLRQYNADVILQANTPEVDGIVLSTPYERVRYEAYLDHLEQHPLGTARAAALAAKMAHTLSFRIYTHSPYAVDDEEEEWQQAYQKGQVQADPNRTKSYLDLFRSASLRVGNHLVMARPEIDGPYVDNFTLPNGRATFRNLGVLTYTFDTRGLPTQGSFTFSFKDSQGKPYSFTAPLQAYR